MQPSRIPATIISGFLGSGKTTLLRSIMEKITHKRIAIIVNEFGALGIDGEILKKCAVPECEEENIVELTNGCICCTVADEFLPTMEALVNRPFPPQHIIIETSGLALPKPLIKAFNWPDIKTRMTVDGVVTVVDSPAVITGRFADDPEKIAQQRQSNPSLDHDNPLQEVFEDQLNSADLILLNKIDLITTEQLQNLTLQIKKQISKAVKILPILHGKIDPEIVLGIHAEAENDLQTRPSHHDGIDEDHEHDHFINFIAKIPPISSPKALENKLLQLTSLHDILRIKGYVQVVNKPMRLEIHGVGKRFNYHFDLPWKKNENPQGQLIIIGQKNINQKAIQTALETQI